MSAIVAAAQRLEDRRIDAVLGRAFTRGDELRAMIIAAGRAIVAASNAAGAGRVVEGAPRTWAVQWVEVLAGWMIAHDDGPWAATYSEPPTPFLEPARALPRGVSRSAYVGRAIAAYLRLTSIATTLGTTPEAALDRLDPARSGEE